MLHFENGKTTLQTKSAQYHCIQGIEVLYWHRKFIIDIDFLSTDYYSMNQRGFQIHPFTSNTLLRQKQKGYEGYMAKKFKRTKAKHIKKPSKTFHQEINTYQYSLSQNLNLDDQNLGKFSQTLAIRGEKCISKTRPSSASPDSKAGNFSFYKSYLTENTLFNNQFLSQKVKRISSKTKQLSSENILKKKSTIHWTNCRGKQQPLKINKVNISLRL